MRRVRFIGSISKYQGIDLHGGRHKKYSPVFSLPKTIIRPICID